MKAIMCPKSAIFKSWDQHVLPASGSLYHTRSLLLNLGIPQLADFEAINFE